MASTPAPTPTPVTYDTLDQTLAQPGDKSFQTAGTLRTGFSNIHETDVAPFGLGDALKIDYVAGSNAYRVTQKDGTSFDFPIAGSFTFEDLQSFDGSNDDRALALLITIPRVANVPLSYTRLADLYRVEYSNQAYSEYLVVWGVPTLPGDMPKKGTATYALAFAGSAGDGDHLYSLNKYSKGTLTANFATGTVGVDLDVIGDWSAPVALGKLTGSGAVTASGYSGTLTGTNGQGWFGGGFFGPQAAETGLTWQYHGTDFEAESFAFGVKK